jgi:hypothetical protein
MHLDHIRFSRDSCANHTNVNLTRSSTSAGSVSYNLVQVFAAHGPFGSTLSILAELFSEKFWMLLVVCFLETIMRELSVSESATLIKLVKIQLEIRWKAEMKAVLTTHQVACHIHVHWSYDHGV